MRNFLNAKGIKNGLKATQKDVGREKIKTKPNTEKPTTTLPLP